MTIENAITIAREATVAILRYRKVASQKVKKNKTVPAKYQLFWGSGLGIVADRYVLTAFHVLNGGEPRDVRDKFVVFTVPGNGPAAHHFPVIGFPIESPAADLAVLEVGPSTIAGAHLPALALSSASHPDGTRVLTLGFPAPEVQAIDISESDEYRSGQFFLKSHANEGIVAAQYAANGSLIYEFNVGWHHGESGGPVLSYDENPTAFTVMSHYRNVPSPNGVLAGPRRGFALSSIGQSLTSLGATIA